MNFWLFLRSGDAKFRTSALDSSLRTCFEFFFCKMEMKFWKTSQIVEQKTTFWGKGFLKIIFIFHDFLVLKFSFRKPLSFLKDLIHFFGKTTFSYQSQKLIFLNFEGLKMRFFQQKNEFEFDAFKLKKWEKWFLQAQEKSYQNVFFRILANQKFYLLKISFQREKVFRKNSELFFYRVQKRAKILIDLTIILKITRSR